MTPLPSVGCTQSQMRKESPLSGLWGVPKIRSTSPARRALVERLDVGGMQDRVALRTKVALRALGLGAREVKEEHPVLYLVELGHLKPANVDTVGVIHGETPPQGGLALLDGLDFDL